MLLDREVFPFVPKGLACCAGERHDKHALELDLQEVVAALQESVGPIDGQQARISPADAAPTTVRCRSTITMRG